MQRYLDGWEIINRMIREDTSWGGRERNCLHVACDDGTFVDISAAARSDFISDGRALARIDIDRDGRPDLVLRNRNAPQIRILRNSWPAGKALWLRLEGSKSNRDAIGARVTVESRGSRQAREVSAGRAFLSQSSRWLAFGLGDATSAGRVTVRWPSGFVESHEGLDPEQRWLLVEGREPAAVPLVRRTDSIYEKLVPAAPPEDTADKRASPALSSWLLSPLPAPRTILEDREGKPRQPQEWRGRPVIVHLLSGSCAVCREELPRLKAVADDAGDTGVITAFVAVDPGGVFDDPLGFLGELPSSAVALRADHRALAGWNTIFRGLFNWRRDLVVPTSFLLDTNGHIVKVYRGKSDARTLLADVDSIPTNADDRRRLALPFPGRVLHTKFERNVKDLASALSDAGLSELARDIYSSTLGANPSASGDLDALFNYAVSLVGSGETERARQLYKRILGERPDFDDAHNNLGVLAVKDGNTLTARRHFEQALATNPANIDAALNLATTHLEPGPNDGPPRGPAAVSVLLRAREHDPENSLVLRKLGRAYFVVNDRPAGIAVLREAIRVDPADPTSYHFLAILLMAEGYAKDAVEVSRDGLRHGPQHGGLHNTLGMGLQQLGKRTDAINALRKAIELDPRLDRPYLNLARIHGEADELDAATGVLGLLLQSVPDHPAAQQMLREIDRAREGGAPR